MPKRVRQENYKCIGSIDRLGDDKKKVIRRWNFDKKKVEKIFFLVFFPYLC